MLGQVDHLNIPANQKIRHFAVGTDAALVAAGLDIGVIDSVANLAGGLLDVGVEVCPVVVQIAHH